ncbi:MAG: arylsulfatase A-like enzyme [Rhodothermales bacterium]|jgi:arylsulfatase A-like enzyme
MNRLVPKGTVVWLGLLFACPLIAANPPNIIFVIYDDLGAGDSSVLWQNGRQGKQKFATPSFDQFAKEGLTLNRSITAPLPRAASPPTN